MHEFCRTEEEIGNFIYVAIGIAACTVVMMYGWMGYTLYSVSEPVAC